MEVVGGSRYGNSNSSNIEVAGGYVSYINGGPRDGRGVIGGGNGQTAVSISVLDGIIDYIYGGAKDGNTNVNSAPIVNCFVLG